MIKPISALARVCTYINLCVSALFLFTDTFMLAHTSNTESLHYASFWCLKSETGWCVTKTTGFAFCFFSGCFLAWTDPANTFGRTEEQKESERDGVMCLGKFAAHVLNAWYICMCIHHRSLSWTLLFPPLPAFVCSAPVCLTCSLWKRMMLHFFTNSLDLAARSACRLLNREGRHGWTELTGREKQNSAEGVRRWPEANVCHEIPCCWIISLEASVFTCPSIIVFCEIWQERDLWSRLIFYFDWMESFSFQWGDRSASSSWLWPEQRFDFS